MIELVWFLVSIAAILLIARKSLPLALLAGSLLLGVLVLPLPVVAEQFTAVITEPSILLLAIAVGIIPIIGGIMEETGQMEHLVKNLRIGKKPFLAFAPALLGMLPMPGGALMSAPLIKRAGKNVSGRVKAALNVWFRHILLLVYPLGPSLIASAKIAGVGLYDAMLSLAPFFGISILLGWWFFLRGVKGKIDYGKKFSPKWLFLPLAVILSAPAVDLTLKILFQPQLAEAATVAAVSVGLVLAVLVGRPGRKKAWKVFREMKPWTFSLIIFGMFFFLYVFQASPLPQSIAMLPLNAAMLLVLLGFFLGFATGRITVPASILVPVFLAKYTLGSMPLQGFALMYFSVFLGYAVSPVHPCVSVSLQYFKSNLSEYLKTLALPTVIALAVSFALALVLI